MAAGLGMDMNTAALLAAKSVTTTTDALSRYFGTGLAGVEGQSKRAAVLTEALTKKFDGQAEAVAKVGTGPLVMLKNRYGDLQEATGALILNGEIFRGLLSKIGDRVADLTVFLEALRIQIEKNEGAFPKLIKIFGVILTIANPAIAGLNQLIKLGGKWGETIVDDTNSAKDLITQLRELLDELKGTEDEIEVVDRVMTNWGETLKEAMDVPLKQLHFADLLEGWDEMPKLIDHATESMEKMKLKGEDLVTTLADGFAMMYEGMGGGLEEFAANFGNTVKRIIAALLGQAVATMIVNGINASKTAGPLALALAPALAAAGAGIAKSLFSSLVPSFANEGQVNRPTLAMVGDYAGAASNPEFMLKKSTLEGLGSNIHITINSKMKGRDLYQTVQRYERFLNNT